MNYDEQFKNKHCMICGCVYPAAYIKPLLMDGGPRNACPICMLTVFESHPIPDAYMDKIYFPFRHWLNTNIGMSYMRENSWRFQAYSFLNKETNLMEVKMVIYPVRCCYVSVFSPSKKPNSDDKQYTLVAMVPLKDKNLVNIVKRAETEAIKSGIEKGKFTKAQASAPTFKRIIRDGNTAVEAEERGPEFKDMLFFSCNRPEASGAPEVVKRDPTTKEIVPILEQDQFYSGAWAALDINFFPYNAGGSKGVAVGLNSVMLYKDDERLDGRASARSAFDGLEDELEEGEVDSADADVIEEDDFLK